MSPEWRTMPRGWNDGWGEPDGRPTIGERYAEAIQGAGEMRRRAMWRAGIAWAVTTQPEREQGIPAGTFPAIAEMAAYFAGQP